MVLYQELIAISLSELFYIVAKRQLEFIFVVSKINKKKILYKQKYRLKHDTYPQYRNLGFGIF